MSTIEIVKAIIGDSPLAALAQQRGGLLIISAFAACWKIRHAARESQI